MNNIIRVGDKTTDGGTVQSGSTVIIFRGIGAARQGDSVISPIPAHGQTVITEGHPTLHDHTIPVAFHDHRCECGCALISSLPRATAS